MTLKLNYIENRTFQEALLDTGGVLAVGLQKFLSAAVKMLWLCILLTVMLFPETLHGNNYSSQAHVF